MSVLFISAYVMRCCAKSMFAQQQENTKTLVAYKHIANFPSFHEDKLRSLIAINPY